MGSVSYIISLGASVILILVILALAVFLPGNQFLPLASLAGMFYLFPMVLPFTKGNVVKTLIIGLVTLIIGLYFVTDMAPDFTLAANQVYEATHDATAHIPEGFLGGALDFAASFFGWTIYKLSCHIKYVGSACYHYPWYDALQPQPHHQGREGRQVSKPIAKRK